MGQRGNYAAVKDAQIKLREEECALGTGQRSNYATVKDVQIKFAKGECALGMGQRSNDATLKDAQILHRMEECALSTEQRSNNATVMDAQTMPCVAEYVGGTAQSAIHTKMYCNRVRNRGDYCSSNPPQRACFWCRREWTRSKWCFRRVTILCQVIVVGLMSHILLFCAVCRCDVNFFLDQYQYLRAIEYFLFHAFQTCCNSW
jgi:hypothetical protein